MLWNKLTSSQTLMLGENPPENAEDIEKRQTKNEIMDEVRRRVVSASYDHSRQPSLREDRVHQKVRSKRE